MSLSSGTFCAAAREYHSLEGAGDSRGMPVQYTVSPITPSQMLGIAPRLSHTSAGGLMIAVKAGFRLISVRVE